MSHHVITAAVPLANADLYVDWMRKSLFDKAYFFDKLENCSSYIDFGCADGALGRLLQTLDPKIKYLGYDIDPLMVERVNAQEWSSSFWGTDDWIDVLAQMRRFREPHAFIANSVLHEIYGYGDEDEIAKFWDRAFHSGFAYVCIRDMLPPLFEREELTGHRWTYLDLRTSSDILSEERVREKADPVRLAEFESVWGKISLEVNLVHFLMKYRYVENWDREVKENYFPVGFHDAMEIMKKMAATNGYVLDFVDRYCLKFNRDQIRKDFGIDFSVKTHAKIIFKRV